jgi:antitoxin (DNA-binding transcriptional repressor) of toxin-antitoxin stability system
MTYTVQQAQEDFSRLLKEAEEGKEVVIARDSVGGGGGTDGAA